MPLFGKYQTIHLYHFMMAMIGVGGIVGLFVYRKNIKFILIIVILVIGAEIIAVYGSSWYGDILKYIYNNEFKDYPEVVAFYDRYNFVDIYAPNHHYIRYAHHFNDNTVITLNIRHGSDYPITEMTVYCTSGDYTVSENIVFYLKNYNCLEDKYP